MYHPNNLKNREFDQEAPQNVCSEQAAIAERQDASESKHSEAKPTPSKTDFSSYLGVLFDELIQQQKMKLLVCAKRIVPQVTEEDLLQPNDFPELELSPGFRYEEGILEGLMTARMAYLRAVKELEFNLKLGFNSSL